MALVSKHGLMEQNMLESGEKTEHMEREPLYMLMEISMMVSGPMIKLMV